HRRRGGAREVAPAYRDARSTPAVSRLRLQGRGADGSVVYIATSGKPVFDADARFLGYRGVSSNVTAAVRADQAEKALHQAQAELARVTRVTTLGELAASIAHEVNQPLAAIGADANACLHWLATDRPDLDSVRE